MIRRHYFLLLMLLTAATVTGCKTSQPAERPNAGKASHAVGLDTTQQTAHIYVQPAQKPALLPRITDAIGISTPEGRARRQAVRLAKASVPRSIKVKDGAFAWGTYAKAANAGKNSTQATDSAAALNTGGGAAAVGAGATATGGATKPEALGLLATLGKPVGYVLALALAGVAAYLVYLIWAFLPRRKDNAA